MSLQVHELANLRLVEKYFEQLPSDDLSRRYYNGEKYETGLTNRIMLLFSTRSIYDELHRFYPYQPLVKATRDAYLQKMADNQKLGLCVSVFLGLMINGAARRNVVAPILSKFGRFMKTHRLVRHYIWALFLPNFMAYFFTNYYFLNQTELLWAIHAQRMNKQLEDPLGTEYPYEKLPASMVGIWQPTNTIIHDLKQKWANQTHIGLAPDYQEPDPEESWEMAVEEKDQEDDEEEGEGDENEDDD